MQISLVGVRIDKKERHKEKSTMRLISGERGVSVLLGLRIGHLKKLRFGGKHETTVPRLTVI